MARTTTNYGWNISEGSDLVNPLTDIFPNFESLDTDLKEVSDASIGEATELKTGTVHALTRTDTDKDVFKFTATSNFTAGDTFTVDSEQVSALTTSGEQLTTGCYIIGSEVLVAKKGTLLTFYISNVITDASTLEGHDASYFATASDLSDTNADVLTLSNKVGTAILTTQAQDCSGAINELNANQSIRYNSQTDMVQIYYNGTWNDWKRGYMQSLALFSDGVLASGFSLMGNVSIVNDLININTGSGRGISPTIDNSNGEYTTMTIIGRSGGGGNLMVYANSEGGSAVATFPSTSMTTQTINVASVSTIDIRFAISGGSTTCYIQEIILS